MLMYLSVIRLPFFDFGLLNPNDLDMDIFIFKLTVFSMFSKEKQKRS